MRKKARKESMLLSLMRTAVTSKVIDWVYVQCSTYYRRGETQRWGDILRCVEETKTVSG
jgi:hypothetical protein